MGEGAGRVAIFLGHAVMRSISKWFRIICSGRTATTKRKEEEEEHTARQLNKTPKSSECPFGPCGNLCSKLRTKSISKLVFFLSLLCRTPFPLPLTPLSFRSWFMTNLPDLIKLPHTPFGLSIRSTLSSALDWTVSSRKALSPFLEIGKMVLYHACLSLVSPVCVWHLSAQRAN